MFLPSSNNFFRLLHVARKENVSVSKEILKTIPKSSRKQWRKDQQTTKEDDLKQIEQR